MRFSQLVKEGSQFPRLVKVPMFRAGDYDEKGRYTEDDLDAMANSYNPEYLEAPVTRDHIDYGPADGWIERVYREGDTLFGDWQVHPDTLALLQEGKYKRRSIEFYRKHKMPDGSVVPYVKACSILGAATPHVKGMPNIEFAVDSDSLAVDFEVAPQEEFHFSEKERSVMKFTLPAQFARFASRFTDSMSEEEKSKTFADILSEIAEENAKKDEELQSVKSSLSAKDTEITSLKTKFEEQGKSIADIVADNRRTKAEAKFDKALAENRDKVSPAVERYLRSLFMQHAETPLSEKIEFKESDTAEAKQIHTTDLILELMSNLAPVVSLSKTPRLGNTAAHKQPGGGLSRPDPEDKQANIDFNERIMKEADALMKEDPKMDYGDAMIEAERRLTA